MSSEDELNKKFINDFKVKDARCMSMSGSREGQWPTVLAYTLRDIPLTYNDPYFTTDKDKKSIGVDVFVVDCIRAGYTKVPYRNQGGKTVVDKDAKPLSELVKTTADGIEFSTVTCYPWTIVPGYPKNKDERKEDDDLKWAIQPGTVFKFSIFRDGLRDSPSTGNLKSGLCPAGLDIIPAFTLLELDLSIKVCFCL
jgi:hypothetical protein